MSYRERAVWAGMLAVAFVTAFALFIRRNPLPVDLNHSPLISIPKSSSFVLDHEIIDLTHPLSPNMPVFPGGENFRMTKLSDWQRGFYLNKFSMGEHCGTHIDAPLHFESQGKGVDELPIQDLFGPTVIIDCESQCASNADFELQLEDVRRWEKQK